MGLKYKHPLGLGRTGRAGRHGWHLAGGGPRRLEGRAGPARETPARALSRGPAESHQRHCVDSCGWRLRTWHRDSGHTTSGSSGPAPADDVTAPCGRSRDRGARLRVSFLPDARSCACTRPCKDTLKVPPPQQ